MFVKEYGKFFTVWAAHRLKKSYGRTHTKGYTTFYKKRSFKSSCIVIHVHRSFSTLRKVNRVTQVNVRPWCAQEVILINKVAAG